MHGQIHTWPKHVQPIVRSPASQIWGTGHFRSRGIWKDWKIILPAPLLCNSFDWEPHVWKCMKSVSSCLCAVQISSPCIHALRLMLKKSSFVVRKASMSRYHIRSCHMLPKSKLFCKKCWWNTVSPYLARLMEIITARTKYSRYFVHNFSTSFSLTASLATGTQDLSISKNVQNGVQITFHFRSKIRSKTFRKLFKLLRM